MGKSTYVSRGKKFGTVEVRYATEEIAASLATTVLRAETFIMWPSYKGRRGVRVKIPNIPPEVKTEWLATAILGAAEEEVEVESFKESNVINWRGYGVELCLMATKEDIERFPYRIEIEDEKTLSVIVEGRKPNCYLCGTRGHIKKECPLYEFVAECEQELEKKNTVNEKENIEKETKQQEKGNNKSMKEKEIKEKKEIEPKQSQEKKKEKETTGKKQERDQNQTKRKDGTQKEKEKEHKTREKERTDKEPKRQEKEEERKEGKKREREKQREENKEEISPKRKTRENVGRKQDHGFYKLVTFHFCPEMKELTCSTEGHVWVDRMTDQWQETALIPEERVAEFLRAAGESVIFYTGVRMKERLPEGSVIDFRDLKGIMEYV
ncbi:XP_036361568.1uncharacterized protein LOC118764671 [Octopus vulgaris]|uniref:XP_036361568.1uncharacterized protein LOC118764671 n=1 Tax=Octopus vulgaris TaxID=6645 RepID=A0AA36AFM6_OCTVU|nr:XP_036361568.1uncharacterized protein LOC118764671 [Octopus vulgaris]